MRRIERVAPRAVGWLKRLRRADVRRRLARTKMRFPWRHTRAAERHKSRCTPWASVADRTALARRAALSDRTALARRAAFSDRTAFARWSAFTDWAARAGWS